MKYSQPFTTRVSIGFHTRKEKNRESAMPPENGGTLANTLIVEISE